MKTGNSNTVKDYTVYNFRRRGNVCSVSESPLSLTGNEKWNVSCEISFSEGSARLFYMLRTEDQQKEVKILFNNKNSVYAIRQEDNSLKRVNKSKAGNHVLVKIPSKLQLGAGSYNVWYREGMDVDN